MEIYCSVPGLWLSYKLFRGFADYLHVASLFQAVQWGTDPERQNKTRWHFIQLHFCLLFFILSLCSHKKKKEVKKKAKSVSLQICRFFFSIIPGLLRQQSLFPSQAIFFKKNSNSYCHMNKYILPLYNILISFPLRENGSRGREEAGGGYFLG